MRERKSEWQERDLERDAKEQRPQVVPLDSSSSSVHLLHIYLDRISLALSLRSCKHRKRQLGEVHRGK